MSEQAQVERLGREALELPPEERLRLIEIVLDSLEARTDAPSFSAEEEARLGELWDEGLASGPGEALSVEEIIARAKSGTPV
jgi:putative addiction module component (TIGR02574 family)